MVISKSAKLFWLLVLGLLSFSPAMGQESKEVRKTVSLRPDGRVAVHTFKGSVTVTAWDSPTVDIYARIEADGTGSDEIEKVRNTEIQVDGSADSIYIKSDYEKLRDRFSDNNNGSLPFVHYTIQMPRTAKLDIKDHKSKIQVTGLRSEVAINTHKGTADLAQLEGSLKLNTHKGDIRVQFAGLAGESQIDTHKGTIEIAIPRGRGFNLDSRLGRNGHLDSEFPIDTALTKVGREKEYRGAVNGGGPTLRLKTFKGSFRLRQV